MPTQTPFAVLDLGFAARLERPFEWPDFAGGLLRGVFGAALRHVSCMTGYRTCAGCPLVQTCPYPGLFEPPPRDLSATGIRRTQHGLPPPFVLLLPPNGCGQGLDIRFGMRLFGPAIERLAFVVEAWRRALAHGIGRERIRGRLVEVWDAVGGNTLYDGETLADAEPVRRLLEPTGPHLLIRTATPLRFQAKGVRLPPEALTPRRLVADIVRRARILASGVSPEAETETATWPVDTWLDTADTVSHRHDMVWRDWRRYSARQARAMNLGGYVGTWAWANVAPELQQLLALGAILNVGKEASFGLGAYAVTPLLASTQRPRAFSRSRMPSPSTM